jgi:hypothetical protein
LIFKTIITIPSNRGNKRMAWDKFFLKICFY